MEPYQETFDSWDKVAEAYQKAFMDLDIYNPGYEEFLKALGPGSHLVLDAGCGPGNISRFLLSQNPELKIEGIDISPNMVRLAKEKNPAGHFQVGDLRKIKERNPGYQGVICGFALPYLNPEDGRNFISDCASILKEKGILYVSFVAGDPAASGFQTSSTGNRMYFHYYEADFLRKIITENEFIIFYEQEIPFGRRDGSTEFHRVMIARKAG